MVHSNRDATAPIPGEPQQDTANAADRESLHVSSRGLSPDPDSGCGRGVTPDLDRGVALRTMRPPFRGPFEGRTQAQDSTRHLLTLTLIPGLTARVIAQLAQRAPLAEVVAHPDEHADLVPEAGRAGLRSGRAAERADLESAAAARLGIALVALADPRYPALLRRIYDPPPVLYVRGILAEDDDAATVAVVGSRAATAAGRTLARSMARDLAAWGATVVSGLARGIDTAAHEGALDAAGRTVAVLGCGLDRMYPPENERLAGRITVAGRGRVRVRARDPAAARALPAAQSRHRRLEPRRGRRRGGRAQRRAQHRPLRGGRGARRPGRSGTSHPARVRGHQPADPGRRRPGAVGASTWRRSSASSSPTAAPGARRPPAGRPRRGRAGDPGGAARSQRP